MPPNNASFFLIMPVCWHRRPRILTICTLASPLPLISHAVEYVPKPITDTPGYALLEGVSSVPAPVVVAPDEQTRAGIDGTWNTFKVKIGSQEQNASALVSTTSSQVWVVNAQACTTGVLGSLPKAVSQMSFEQCASSRGLLFNTSQSSTWSEIGYYGLQTPSTSNVDAIGLFGLDKVVLPLWDEDEGVTMGNTTVGTIGTYATMATPEIWQGRIGLQSAPTKFPSEPSRPSYITGLFQKQLIPSQSFGYTAGAWYRKNQSANYHGNLVLGGYDASRLVSNNVVFIPDANHNLNVGLAGLTVSTPSSTSIDILKETDIDLQINSNVAEIWLPVSVCKAFEQIFGLIFDESTDLYLVDDILHQRLLELNPTITFTLSQAASTGAAGTVEIVLPYGAFDMTASPFYQAINKTSRYFPLRRGSNESQWTLGRTFLQEAYLVVDWERSEFHVYPRDWADKPTDIAAIVSPRYGRAIISPEDGPSKFATWVIVVITLGTIAAVVLFLASVWWVWRRHVRQRLLNASKPEKSGAANDTGDALSLPFGYGHLVFPKAELPGISSVVDARDPFADANAVQQPIYEMMGDIPMFEASGRQLSEKETMIARERNINGVDPHHKAAAAISYAAVSWSTPMMSMEESTVTTRIGRHRHSTISTGSVPYKTVSCPPNCQAQQEAPQPQDHNRRRFSYES